MPTFSGGGGGGSAFNGGTITTPLTINATSNVALRVQDANGVHNLLTAGTANGGFSATASTSPNTSALTLTPSAFTFQDELGHLVFDIEGGYVSLGQVGTVFVTPNNYFATSNHAAPADAELNAGDCALWFDQTNGAAKLMVKAKQADGTVKTASIALA